MRNLLLAGTAGLFLSLGAATAYAVPQNSPYATMVPPDAVDGYVPDSAPAYRCQGYVQNVGCPAGLLEGRSAFVDGEYADDGLGYIDPGFGLIDPGYGYGGRGYGYHRGSRPMGGHFEGGHVGAGGHGSR